MYLRNKISKPEMKCKRNLYWKRSGEFGGCFCLQLRLPSAAWLEMFWIVLRSSRRRTTASTSVRLPKNSSNSNTSCETLQQQKNTWCSTVRYKCYVNAVTSRLLAFDLHWLVERFHHSWQFWAHGFFVTLVVGCTHVALKKGHRPCWRHRFALEMTYEKHPKTCKVLYTMVLAVRF